GYLAETNQYFPGIRRDCLRRRSYTTQPGHAGRQGGFRCERRENRRLANWPADRLPDPAGAARITADLQGHRIRPDARPQGSADRFNRPGTERSHADTRPWDI